MNNFNQQSLKTIGFIVYSILLILIFLFPPTETVNIINRISYFQGWDFIFNLGNNYQIHVTYLLIEILIITLIYIFFLYSQKN